MGNENPTERPDYLFWAFIVWNLGKESKVGKFGIAMLFLVLGLVWFVFKELLISFFWYCRSKQKVCR